MLDTSALRSLDSNRGGKEGDGLSRPPLSVRAGATDCHHHIYGRLWPVDPWALPLPANASVEDCRRLQRRLGISRNVVVQPATYGTDTRVLARSMG